MHVRMMGAGGDTHRQLTHEWERGAEEASAEVSALGLQVPPQPAPHVVQQSLVARFARVLWCGLGQVLNLSVI